MTIHFKIRVNLKVEMFKYFCKSPFRLIDDLRIFVVLVGTDAQKDMEVMVTTDEKYSEQVEGAVNKASWM